MGHNVRVFEAQKSVGGAIKTIKHDQWLIEAGPNTVLLKDQKVRHFIEDDLGLKEELIFANDESKNRYIVKNGRPIPLPTSPQAFVFSRLFSLSAKLRLLKEPFIPPFDAKNPAKESVADFVKRRLGSEFLDYAINPFVGGVFAGDPEKLAVEHAFPKLYQLEQKYGSLIKGQIKGIKERKKAGRYNPDNARIFSFKDGLQRLPAKLAEHLSAEMRLGMSVREIKPKYFTWNVTTLFNGRYQEHKFDKVVLACSPKALSHIDGPWVTSPVERVPTPPVSVVSLGFKRKDVRHPLNGFGMLVPEKEQRKILGTLFSSTLFKERAPYGEVLLTTFVGGSRQPQLTSLADRRLIDMVYLELDELLGIKGSYTFARVDKWPHAIPQYHMGYERVKTLIDAVESDNKDLYLAGNYREGISVGDCIMHAIRIADRIEEENSK